MLFNAYWMLDNHQIFGNDWSYIGQTDEPMLSKHYFTDWHVCQSTPLGYSLGFITLIMIIKHIVPERILEDMGFTIYRHVYQFWENLPKFKDAITPDHLNVMELERQ